MSINRYVCTGNLTRDMEVRRTQGGMAIGSFGIAVNDRRKNNQTGEWGDFPNYLDVTVFGNRAEALANILTKGTKIGIEGKLRWSQWERDGQKRSKIEVIADEIELLGSREDKSSGKSYGRGDPQQVQAEIIEDDEDFCPF